MTTAPMDSADVNWFAVLAHHAVRTPDKAVTVFEGETTTYGEMAARAAELAGGLSERGVGPGDVVALLSYNCPEFLETVFAANYLGAIAMPINWRLAAPEVRYILEHSGARALVCDEPLVDLANEATKGIGAAPSACVYLRLPPPMDGQHSPICASRRSETSRGQAAGDDVHRLMYTSGTTGRPKGVMITHANLAWKNLAHTIEFGFTGSDLGLGVRPAVPRRCARPHDDLADRRGCHDHHPPYL